MKFPLHLSAGGWELTALAPAEAGSDESYLFEEVLLTFGPHQLRLELREKERALTGFATAPKVIRLERRSACCQEWGGRVLRLWDMDRCQLTCDYCSYEQAVPSDVVQEERDSVLVFAEAISVEAHSEEEIQATLEEWFRGDPFEALLQARSLMELLPLVLLAFRETRRSD